MRGGTVKCATGQWNDLITEGVQFVEDSNQRDAMHCCVHICVGVCVCWCVVCVWCLCVVC